MRPGKTSRTWSARSPTTRFNEARAHAPWKGGKARSKKEVGEGLQ